MSALAFWRHWAGAALSVPLVCGPLFLSHYDQFPFIATAENGASTDRQLEAGRVVNVLKINAIILTRLWKQSLEGLS